MRGAVDRVQVHRRLPRRQRRAELRVDLYRRIGDLLDEVGAPVPLVAGRVDAVEGALQPGVRHRPTPCMSGSDTEARNGAIAFAASSSVPTYAHTTPHTLRMWSSSGNGGAGGTVANAKKPFSSRGAAGRNSR